MIHDLVAAITAWWLAYLFRFNFDIPLDHMVASETNLAMGNSDSGNSIPRIWSVSGGLALCEPARSATHSIGGADSNGSRATDVVSATNSSRCAALNSAAGSNSAAAYYGW